MKNNLRHLANRAKNHRAETLSMIFLLLTIFVSICDGHESPPFHTCIHDQLRGTHHDYPRELMRMEDFPVLQRNGKRQARQPIRVTIDTTYFLSSSNKCETVGQQIVLDGQTVTCTADDLMPSGSAKATYALEQIAIGMFGNVL